MARTDYGAILSTVIKDTSDSVRLRENTEALFAPSDWSNEIKKMEMMKVATATAGSIVTFNDGVEQAPFVSLKTAITPVQSGSGDPSPSNPRPISGWDEVKVSAVKQLFNGTLEQGTFNSTSGQMMPSTTRVRATANIPLPSGTYTLNNLNGLQFVLYVYDMEGNFKRDGESYTSWKNTPFTFTLAENRQLNFAIRFPDNSTIVPSDVIGLTLYDSTVGQTATIALPHTVYGAEHDVLSGVGSETMDLISDLSTMSWNRGQSGSVFAFTSNFGSADYEAYAEAICSAYVWQDIRYISQLSDMHFMTYTQGGTTRIAIRNDNYGDADTFENSLSGVQLAIPLATPTTYQADTAQLQARNGTNNVWADAGEISECKYYTHNSGGVTVSELNHGTYVASGVNDANIETGTPYGVATYSSLGKGNVIIDFTASTDTHSNEGRVLIYKNDTLVNTYTLYNSATNDYSAIISVDEGDTVSIKVGWIGSHSGCTFNVYTDTYNIVEG